MSKQRLRELIETRLDDLPPAAILTAFSGGLDSTVLLHLLATSARARQRGLRAIHVDHGLHEDSAQWAQHCRSVAAAFEVELVVCNVGPPLRSMGLGMEGSARRARYGQIETRLKPGEVVALAHHRDDQAETVLLKLLRGAGPEGIGAMRTLRPFGQGFLWRPLLDGGRAVLHDYADKQALSWITDPGNADASIDRNYLRLQVIPRITQRWPEAQASIARSAGWARAAADFINSEAEGVLQRAVGADFATLRFGEWLDLPQALRDPVLRRWLRSLGLPEPTHVQADELVRQFSEAGADRQPCVRWRGAEVRRYRDLLYAMPPLQVPAVDWVARFTGANLALPNALGTLRLAGAGSQSVLVDPLQVRFRRGGERLRLDKGGRTRELRDLFQESGTPPWQRARMPLVLAPDGGLLAVADRWLSDAGDRLFRPLDARIEWIAQPAVEKGH